MNTRLNYQAVIFGGMVLLLSCAHKEDKFKWVHDLPVEAGISNTKSPRQTLVLTKIIDHQEISGELWIRALGYADTNNGTAKYFWEKENLPNLEITFHHAKDPKTMECSLLMDDIASKKRKLYIHALGLFNAKGGEEEGYIGIFRLDSIISCSLGSKID